jgi:hypothetical protein
MNTEAFEKQIKGQPIRKVPAGWRAEILRAAQFKSYPARGFLREPALPWWRAILWPSPQAWAGIAAVWLVILTLQLTSAERAKTASLKSVPASRQVLELLQEQQSLLADLINSSAAVESPKPSLPRPRGEKKSQNTSA